MASQAPSFDRTTRTAEQSFNRYRFFHKSGNGFASFASLPEAYSPQASAKVSLDTLLQSDPNLKVLPQGAQTIHGFDSIIVRRNLNVQSNPYSYLASFIRNAGTGIRLVTYSAPADYVSLESQFATLVGGLRLKQ